MTVSRRPLLAAWLLVGCSGPDPGALFADRPTGAEDGGRASQRVVEQPSGDEDAGTAPERDAGPPRKGDAGTGEARPRLAAGGAGGAASAGGAAAGGIVGVASGGGATAASGGTGGIPHISLGGTSATGGSSSTGGAPACDPAVQCAGRRCYGLEPCGNGVFIDCAKYVRCGDTEYCPAAPGVCTSFFDGLDCDTPNGTITVTVVMPTSTDVIRKCHQPPASNSLCSLEQNEVSRWDCSSRCANRNGTWVCG